MSDALKFKLYKRHTAGRSVVPLCGIVARDKTSRRVHAEYTDNKSKTVQMLTTAVPGTFTTPFSYSKNPDLLRGDLKVSTDSRYNVFFTVPGHASADANVRLLNLTTGVYIETIKVQYLQVDGITYTDTPRSDTEGQSIRILAFDEDVCRAVMVVYTRYESGSLYHNHRELAHDWQDILSDWTLSVSSGKLTITTLSGETTVFVKESAFNRPDIYMPLYDWHQEWYLLVRKGSFINSKRIASTHLTAVGNKPSQHIIKDKARILNRQLIQVSFQDIDTAQNVTVYFNNKEQSDIVDTVDGFTGTIQLRKALPDNVRCTVSYNIHETNWIEARGIDFNPHRGHFNTPTMEPITSVYVDYWVQPASQQGELLFTLSHAPSAAYYDKDGSYRLFDDTWIHIATVNTHASETPQLVDIRTTGGGLKENHKQDVEWPGFTDWGYYDGRPVNNVGLVVRIPKSSYDTVYNAFLKENATRSTTQAKEMTSTYIEDAVKRYAPAGVDVHIEYI